MKIEGLIAVLVPFLVYMFYVLVSMMNSYKDSTIINFCE